MNLYLTPFLYRKLEFAGVWLFLLFLLQNIEAVLTCVPTIYVLSKNKENIKINLVKFSFLTAEKNLFILHWQVFVIMCSILLRTFSHLLFSST